MPVKVGDLRSALHALACISARMNVSANARWVRMSDSALSAQPFLQAPARAPEAPTAALPFALAYSRYLQRQAQAREGWAERVQASVARPIDAAWLSARVTELFDTKAGE